MSSPEVTKVLGSMSALRKVESQKNLDIIDAKDSENPVSDTEVVIYEEEAENELKNPSESQLDLHRSFKIKDQKSEGTLNFVYSQKNLSH